MSHSVRRHLRVDVDAYDQSIRRFIPAYEEMLEQAASALAEARPERVLDLGAGTGALTEAVLQRDPHCSVEIDRQRPDDARTGQETTCAIRFAAEVHRAIVSWATAPLRRGDRFARPAPCADPGCQTGCF